MKHNSYFGMAESDYLFAKASLDNCKAIGIYNSAVAVPAQASEKYLKAVVENASLTIRKACVCCARIT